MAIRDRWIRWRRAVRHAEKLGATPPERPALRWQADIRLAGRRVSKSFEKRSDALGWIAHGKNLEFRGELGIKAKRRIAFSDLCLLFLEEKEKQRRRETFLYYRDQVRPHLSPFFGDTLIDHITREHVTRYIHKRLDAVHNKQRIHPRTVNMEVATLRRIFKFARLNGYYLPEDPTVGISPMKAAPKKVIRFLTDPEVDTLLAVCPTRAYTIFLTAVDTGLRRSELAAFDWTWVEWHRGVIRIKQRNGYETKSHLERDIPMTDRLRDHLSKLTGPHVGPVLFPPSARDVKAGRTIGRFYDFILRELRDLIRKAGLAPFTLHDLRHTFASRLVMRGVDLFTVSKLLGHADVKTTQIYAHLAPGHLQQAIALLNPPRPGTL